jgi:fluoride exporter
VSAVPGPGSWPRRLEVLIGGALGTALRLALVTPLLMVADGAWPLATFSVNVAGALALGVLVARADVGHAWRARLPLLGTGLLGSLTTFSALAVGTVLLAKAGRPLVAGGYLAGSLVAGLLAAGLGLRLGRSDGDRPGSGAPSERLP